MDHKQELLRGLWVAMITSEETKRVISMITSVNPKP